MDYNTQRSKLIMPEYGRHVQKMIEYVSGLEDKEKRNEQIRAVVGVMGILNPQLRDLSDFKHKLWDHVQIISDFEIEIDSPYPIPTKETFYTKPNPIPLDKTPLKAAHYGRNIQNMIDMIADREDDELRRNMVMFLAGYMRQQYIIWNKETVLEDIIFRDINVLSQGRLSVPEDFHLPAFTHSSAAPVNIGHGGHRNEPTHSRGDGYRQDSSHRQSSSQYRGNKKKIFKKK
ncbi:MAG: DUF4290 domain-containing protein [Bacteroidales bacterium]|jgi:hypothetical protein|nr:DUF4290 domain-containing protein [Bacteroidales bacterium]MDZ4058420.1 DUF4290 domain-containing protein [Bacteroidales bacterium]